MRLCVDQHEQQEKLSKFTEFFTISHDFSVNIEKHNNVYKQESFEALIPLPFKLASDNATIDQKALRPIQNLAAVAGQLVDYLHHQANKIDLLVSYILSQHDEVENRFSGSAFGGGGFSFETSENFDMADKLKVKIFLLNYNCAVYCHGEVIEKLPTNNDDKTHLYKVIFENIREEDREMLVRTSLHIQSKQLQTLAKKRNQDQEAKNS